MRRECYGVDLDGTLAQYDGWISKDDIGEPIPAMFNKVKQWIEDGIEVIIFTARADRPENIPPIKVWLERNGIPGLEITNRKYPKMNRIYDDRAVQVQANTGIILGDPSQIKDKSTVGESIEDRFIIRI